MGDSGSMLVGFLLAFQAICFLNEQVAISAYYVDNAPVFALAALSYPLIDTLRVFLIRVINGVSPFSADKNHIHHHLLSLGFKHWQISVMVAMFSISIVCVAFMFRDLAVHWHLVIVFVYALGVTLSPFFMPIKKLMLKKNQL